MPALMMPDSPETPPAARRPAGGRGRLVPVLRLLLVASLMLTLLQPARLADWATARPMLADYPVLQTAMEQVDRMLGVIGFTQGYAWLRRQTRAIQGLRFNAGQDNQQ